MGTRSHIYVETSDGYVGAYCQFDGYPDHMYEQVNKRSHAELYGIVLQATTTCGLRGLTDAGPDFQPSSGSVELLTSPTSSEESSYVDYVYIKRADGTTVYRGGDFSDGWGTWNDGEPVLDSPLT